jgi:phage gp36-like protein
MAYITKSDLQRFVETDQLTIVSQANDTYIADVILTAQEEVAGYIRHRYDVATIFAMSGSSRNQKLVQVMCDIALYHLFTSAVPRNIPEVRLVRYDGNGKSTGGDAVGWLKMVQIGTITMDLPIYTTDEDKGQRVIHGNNTTRW